MVGFRRALAVWAERFQEPDEIIRDKKDDILIEWLLFLRSKRKLVEILKLGLMSTPREQLHECRIRLFAVSAAMFVVCWADKPRDIFRTKLAQMERNSETSLSYQSKRSTFGDGLFRLQS